MSSITPALSNLHIADSDRDLNPWRDDSKPGSPQINEPLPASNPVPLDLFSPPDSLSLQPSHPVLSPFDPLASPEEQAAREAWQTTEGHPPPLPSPPSSAPPPKEDAPTNTVLSPPVPASVSIQPPSRSSSPFPSFAALAKTFSLPNLTRPRPTSMDVARSVPSPSTLSGLVAQQTAETVESPTPPHEGASNAVGGSSSSISEPPTSPADHEEEAEAQFDFQKFLDQMKTRSAEPVSKYLRSFLSNFAKRTFYVSDHQVKIIGNFLNFIAVQMRDCEVWKNASDAEFDNALEGMEKLVMNRLYDFTFTPQVARATPSRPFNPDDLERDRVLAQRISLFGWIQEEHLDIPIGEGSQGFIMFAQQELLKINHYKAPRDKLICILNCCKVIFGLIRHLRRDEGADSFVPILIFVVLKANPPHLLSNVEFINRFRNPVRLQGEAGYYLSSLIGAISFIETMDHTSLSSITKEEFEANVEAAILALPGSEPQSPILARENSISYLSPNEAQSPSSPHAGEESAQPLAMSTPTPSNNIGEDARRLLQKTGDTISKPLSAIGRIFSEALDGAENKLSYLPGPFAPFESSREQHREPVGSQYQQEPKHPQTPTSAGSSGSYGPPIQTPYKARVRKMPSHSQPPSPGGSPFSAALPDETPSRAPKVGPMTNQPLALGPSQPYIPSQSFYHPPLPHGYPEKHMYNHPPPLPSRPQSLGGAEGSPRLGPNLGDALHHISRTPTPNLDLSGMQAEIDVAHARAAAAARETLIQIFPEADVEVIELVLEANGGDLGKTIEGLLELNSGG